MRIRAFDKQSVVHRHLSKNFRAPQKFALREAQVFLNDLQDVLGCVEQFETTTTEKEAVGDLAQLLSDLIQTVEPFQERTAKGKRKEVSLQAQFNVARRLHLQQVSDSVEAIIDEHVEFVQALPAILKRPGQSGTIHDGFDDDRLQDKSWYRDVRDNLGLQTETLKALGMATDILTLDYDTGHDSGRPVVTQSSLSTSLHFQIKLARQKARLCQNYATPAIENGLIVAESVTLYSPPIPNKHFVNVRNTRDYFSGREKQLAQLEAAFADTLLPRQQRFVVYGLSGCGKTELACRFAHQSRDRFWGVFFPNDRAAKDWLVTRDLPWLLILDNVDGEDADFADLLPQGAKGCILITTRNPDYKTHSNAGSRHLELQPMEPDEAELLITTAAEEPRPWRKVVVDSAGEICHVLGFLPLALVQAATAILRGICDWPRYLGYHEIQMQRLRRVKHSSRSRKPWGSQGEDAGRLDNGDRNSLNVFSTYEILYESLLASCREEHRDAVELLHVFSFFHFQDIRLETLMAAATNPLREEGQARADSEEEQALLQKSQMQQKSGSHLPRRPWAMMLREWRAFVFSKLAMPPFPLPGVLRNSEGLDLDELEVELEIRLRLALGALLERSLIIARDKESGHYSMHRLVHWWVRERPEMSTAHQAVWCHVSATTLAWSVRRPPHGDGDDKSRARRRLLPHVRHVQECQTDLDRRLGANAAKLRPSWSWSWPRAERQVQLTAHQYGSSCYYRRVQAEQDVRFSRVYVDTGCFHEARLLQERALAFVSGRLGRDHPFAIRLSLLLSVTLWQLSEIDEAMRHQREARALCIATLGEHHPLTLDVTELLRSALYMKGRWAEATSLHERNIKTLHLLYGEAHEKTLRCMRNLARLHYHYMEYDRATHLYQTAWRGMRKALGESHLETLTCLEDLAMSYVRYDEEAEPSTTAGADNASLALSHEQMVGQTVWMVAVGICQLAVRLFLDEPITDALSAGKLPEPRQYLCIDGPGQQEADMRVANVALGHDQAGTNHGLGLLALA
ncbi:kinesin light chain [Grosmannia clavigera kw1407]|uniref:Kinesin light chain n=1 Tax=Grosmannia clavigera (strain kw1407 / UAMH 11150) TaxID=655863 RepID=F0XU84_GROCL|nr:kinesin light chain [Grosmannia clavigera kw1407]EFW98742.1 kinesin light chain [Grosmannia clavigera kw1407]